VAEQGIRPDPRGALDREKLGADGVHGRDRGALDQPSDGLARSTCALAGAGELLQSGREELGNAILAVVHGRSIRIGSDGSSVHAAIVARRYSEIVRRREGFG
jgi:hypothetical protein